MTGKSCYNSGVVFEIWRFYQNSAGADVLMRVKVQLLKIIV